MFIYYLIFLILSIFAYREVNDPKPLNIYYLIFFIILFSIFIGLRHEIGCDWSAYRKVFDGDFCGSGVNCLSTIEYLKFKEIGFSSINYLVRYFGGNFSTANFILSLLFVIPLLISLSSFRRPFLGILVSYPYLITVIGMGTIRQSISIAFLMLCLNEIGKNRFKRHFVYSFISVLFHYSSLIFIFLPFLVEKRSSKNLKTLKKYSLILSILFVVFILIFNNHYFSQQISGYLFHPEPISIKSPLVIWIKIAIPSFILLLNYEKYKKYDKNKLWRNFSIIGLLMFFSIFINTVVALRLLLYFLPIQIYALSNAPDLNILKTSPKNTYLVILTFSFLVLSLWLNFANHSYCYVPYENILLK